MALNVKTDTATDVVWKTQKNGIRKLLKSVDMFVSLLTYVEETNKSNDYFVLKLTNAD